MSFNRARQGTRAGGESGTQAKIRPDGPVSIALAWAAAALAACGSTSQNPGPPAVRPDVARPAHPWPMFRGDPLHAGERSDRPTPSWRVRWTHQTGERIDASAVITADGRAIVATRAGQIAALDLATGEPVRSVRLSDGVWSSPALVGEVLVVAVRDGHVAGLDATTLATLWRTRAPSGAFSAVTVAAAAGVPRVYLCSGDRFLILDPATGGVLARLALSGQSYTAPAVMFPFPADAPATDGRGLAVVGDRAGEVVAIEIAGAAGDAPTARVLWRAVTTAGAHNDGSPAIALAGSTRAGDRGEPAAVAQPAAPLVLLGSNDDAMYAFALADGARSWRVAGDGWVVSTPAIARGVAYFGDDGGVVRALAVSDGHEVWRTRVGDDVGSSPTIVGDLVIHAAHDRKLHAHDARDGSSRPSIDIGAPAYASPAVARDGAVVIATHDGAVIAVE